MKYSTKLPSLADARAQAEAARGPIPRKRPWYRKRRSLVLCVVPVIVIMIVATRGDNTAGGQAVAARIDPNVEPDPGAADVTVGRLGPRGVQGLRTVDVAVTNSTTRRANYTIELVFESPGGKQLGSAIITFANIAPGESSTKLVSPVAGKDLPGDTEVKLKSVTRSAS